MQIGPPDKMRGTLRPSGIVFDNLALQSLRGYGLLIDSPRRATWDLGHRDLSTFSYKASGGGLQYYVFSGPDLPELLHTYLELTGYPPIPPRWALGLLQSRYGYRNRSELESVARTFRDKKLPGDALILDVYWFREMGDLLSIFSTSQIHLREQVKSNCDRLARGQRVVTNP